jgi:hypothetical protein
MQWIKNMEEWSINRGIYIGLLSSLWLSDASFGSEFDDPLNPLGADFETPYVSSFGLERTDIDQTLEYFAKMRSIFGDNPLLDNPHVRTIELKANEAWLASLINLTLEERKNKLQEKFAELRQEHAKRRHLAANPAIKNNLDEQRQRHIDWLKTLLDLPIEELEIQKNGMQMQLHTARSKSDQSLIDRLQFQLRELDALIRMRPSTSREALEKLCEWYQAVEELPLEKWEEQLRRNWSVSQEILRINEENPQELTQHIQELVRHIEATLEYLRIITHPTDSGPGSPFSLLRDPLNFDL